MTFDNEPSLEDRLLPAFYCDGSFRDIYVLGTDEDDWEKLLAAIWDSDLRFEVSEPFTGLSSLSAPAIKEFFESDQPVTSSTLWLSEGIRANCHFFCVDEIEFDIDPREISSPTDVSYVLKLMKMIGDSVGKPVVLTPENIQESTYAAYEPTSNSFTVNYEQPRRKPWWKLW